MQKKDKYREILEEIFCLPSKVDNLVFKGGNKRNLFSKESRFSKDVDISVIDDNISNILSVVDKIVKEIEKKFNIIKQENNKKYSKKNNVYKIYIDTNDIIGNNIEIEIFDKFYNSNFPNNFPIKTLIEKRRINNTDVFIQKLEIDIIDKIMIIFSKLVNDPKTAYSQNTFSRAVFDLNEFWKEEINLEIFNIQLKYSFNNFDKNNIINQINRIINKSKYLKALALNIKDLHHNKNITFEEVFNKSKESLNKIIKLIINTKNK